MAAQVSEVADPSQFNSRSTNRGGYRGYRSLSLKFRFCPSTICLQLRQMFFRPATESVQRLNQRSAETRQRVLNFRRNDRVNFALHQTVVLEAAQSLR